MNKRMLHDLMKSIVISLIVPMILTSCSYCEGTPEGDKLSEFHDKFFRQESRSIKSDNLSLFVDYSTCIAQGQNSSFYNALTPSFVAATKDYYSIKGNNIQKEQGETFQLLRTIGEVNYADLKSAINQMADADSESALLTDGEFFQQSIARGNINNPYMAEAFEKWLLKGYDIYIISEPYVESVANRSYNKQRFYFLFTDSRIPNNIYSRISQTVNFENYPGVEVFHLSADHPSLLSENGVSSSPNGLLEAKVTPYGSYEIQDWQLTWKDGIEPLILGAVNPETGAPLPSGDRITNGLKLDRNSFGAYRITGLDVKVYNINDIYTAYYSETDAGNLFDMEGWEFSAIPNFIKLNDQEFNIYGNIELNFDTQMYNASEFLTGCPYNYTKVDLYINEITPILEQYAEMFKFDSIDVPGESNVSVLSSIQQCMTNPAIKQKIMDSPIYTIYIKSFER